MLEIGSCCLWPDDWFQTRWNFEASMKSPHCFLKCYINGCLDHSHYLTFPIRKDKILISTTLPHYVQLCLLNKGKYLFLLSPVVLF